MSTNLIEDLARKAKTGLAGTVSSPSTAQHHNERGGQLVSNLATGGLALGTGVGAAVALINYLKTIREENELEDASRLNDDTLYISAPQQKAAAEVNRWVAPGLAVTGGILAAGGSYALTQAVYNYLQKKHKEKLLDEAQGEALRAADLEVSKQAATNEAKLNLYDLISATPVALPLLAAIASGGVTFAALRKTFPTVKPTKSKHPKRIRQVASDGKVSEIKEEDDILKSAADAWAEEDCEAAGNEFLMLMVDQLATEKSAATCLTSELLHKVARDGIAGVAATQRDGGIEALTELVKGAAEEPVTLPQKVLAAAVICKSARLRTLAAAVAAAEFRELLPSLTDEIFSHGAEQLEKFAGIAPLLHITFFRPQMLEKSAMDSVLAEELERMLSEDQTLKANPQMGDPAISDEMLEDLTSDAAGGMSEDAEGGDIPAELGEHIQPNNPDPVDAFMESESLNSPILEPEIEDHHTQTDAHPAAVS